MFFFLRSLFYLHNHLTIIVSARCNYFLHYPNPNMLYCVLRCFSYCMRVNPSLVEDWDSDNWVCESCEQGNGMLSPNSSIKEDTLESSTSRGHYDGVHSTGPSRNCNGSGWQSHSKRQKPVVNGKVKFITNEKFRRLSLADPSQKTPVGYKTITPKSPVSGVKENQNLKHSQADVFIPATDAETCKKKETASKKKRAPGTPTKGHIIKEQPIDASLLSEGVETSSRMTVEEQTKFSCTPSTSRHSPFNNSYGPYGGNTSTDENNHSDDRERDHLNKFPSFHSYSPALHATWKGGFIILDSETPAQFIGGFQAQPPCTVHQ
ncbi:uncharacterized protein LOC112196411 isoform X3 [Rosa chinensis]|uniref:uncharacterized protein LOC112196411 isoform X3 n=1 Tax=Rosa chinensis TaxID=74649 RepID=UPI001AD8D1CD|nr:uncharacterized protein LOC112196411 isoform X3 [Rosa chinensis]